MKRVNIVLDVKTIERINKYRSLGIQVNVSRICREGINKYLDGIIELRVKQIKAQIMDLENTINNLENRNNPFQRILKEQFDPELARSLCVRG